jgi:hypothetical protein
MPFGHLTHPWGPSRSPFDSVSAAPILKINHRSLKDAKNGSYGGAMWSHPAEEYQQLRAHPPMSQCSRLIADPAQSQKGGRENQARLLTS